MIEPDLSALKCTPLPRSPTFESERQFLDKAVSAYVKEESIEAEVFTLEI